jgi:hypothetical protein
MCDKTRQSYQRHDGNGPTLDLRVGPLARVPELDRHRNPASGSLPKQNKQGVVFGGIMEHGKVPSRTRLIK